jgi:hypothetical protein
MAAVRLMVVSEDMRARIGTADTGEHRSWADARPGLSDPPCGGRRL